MFFFTYFCSLLARSCELLDASTLSLQREPAILQLSGLQLLSWFAFQVSDASSAAAQNCATPAYTIRCIFGRACVPFLRLVLLGWYLIYI